jgi:hypothetical protein
MMKKLLAAVFALSVVSSGRAVAQAGSGLTQVRGHVCHQAIDAR